jgi:protein-S-isoprenylcysteine O-methyltransferase Ste14
VGMKPLPFVGATVCEFVFWGTFCLWLAMETIGARLKRSDDNSKARDKGSLTLIKLLLCVALGFDFALSFLLPQAAIVWKPSLLFWIGIILMIVGPGLRLYSMSVLGRFFTYDVALHAGQTVVQTGPYRFIRHPSYTAVLLTLLGVGLALGNWAGLVLLFGLMAIAYAYRIRVEERALIEAMGESYEEYRRRTKRLIPFVL